MTNEEAINVLKRRTECAKTDSLKCVKTGCDDCEFFYTEEHLAEASAIAINVLEKQERIHTEIEELKERYPYSLMVIGSVIHLLEECEVK